MRGQKVVFGSRTMPNRKYLVRRAESLCTVLCIAAPSHGNISILSVPVCSCSSFGCSTWHGDASAATRSEYFRTSVVFFEGGQPTLSPFTFRRHRKRSNGVSVGVCIRLGAGHRSEADHLIWPWGIICSAPRWQNFRGVIARSRCTWEGASRSEFL